MGVEPCNIRYLSVYHGFMWLKVVPTTIFVHWRISRKTTNEEVHASFRWLHLFLRLHILIFFFLSYFYTFDCSKTISPLHMSLGLIYAPCVYLCVQWMMALDSIWRLDSIPFSLFFFFFFHFFMVLKWKQFFFHPVGVTLANGTINIFI